MSLCKSCRCVKFLYIILHNVRQMNMYIIVLYNSFYREEKYRQGQHHSTYLFFLDNLFPAIFCEYISIRYKRKGKEAITNKKNVDDN
jgi:hypothetical protein